MNIQLLLVDIIPHLADSLALTAEHTELIKDELTKSPVGDFIWTYFGTFIIGFIGLVLAIIRFYAYSIIKKVETIVYKKFTHPVEELQKLKMVDSKIDTLLNSLKEKVKAKRVVLYQFQNGSHYFSHIPVIKVTATNFCKEAKDNPESNFVNYDTCKDLIQELISESPVAVSFQDSKHRLYAQYLKFSRYSNSVLVRLDLNKQYVGVLEILDPEDINIDAIIHTTTKIEAVLDLFKEDNKNKKNIN